MTEIDIDEFVGTNDWTIPVRSITAECKYGPAISRPCQACIAAGLKDAYLEGFKTGLAVVSSLAASEEGP